MTLYIVFDTMNELLLHAPTILCLGRRGVVGQSGHAALPRIVQASPTFEFFVGGAGLQTSSDSLQSVLGLFSSLPASYHSMLKIFWRLQNWLFVLVLN